MNILLWPFFARPNIGGLETMVHTLALGLRKNGHSVHVISETLRTTRSEHARLDGISYYYFPFTHCIKKKNILEVIQLVQEVKTCIDSLGIEIINIHGWNEAASFFQMRVLNTLSLPHILTVHGFGEDDRRIGPQGKSIWRAAKGVTTVSHALTSSLLSFGLSHTRLSTIQNGLPPSLFPLSSPRKQHILMSGRLSREKGFDIGIQAFADITRAFPNATLSILGEGIEKHALKQMAKDLNIQDKVTFKGWVSPEDIWTHIDTASIVLVPSRSEAFGLVALEAGLRARPVVASKVLGLEETVSHMRTGVHFTNGSSKACAKALERLLSAPALGVTLGQEGKRVAETAFSDRTMVARFEEEYAHALQSQYEAVSPGENV